MYRMGIILFALLLLSQLSYSDNKKDSDKGLTTTNKHTENVRKVATAKPTQASHTRAYPYEVPFKILKTPVHWQIESVTCIDCKTNGFNLEIKGVGRKKKSSGCAGNVYIAVEKKKGRLQMLGSFVFPDVEEGMPFKLEVSVSLQKGFTPCNVGNFVFLGGVDHEEGE